MTNDCNPCAGARGPNRRLDTRTALQSSLLLTVYMLTTCVSAESLTLHWDPASSDDRVAGYELHVGTSSGEYQWMFDAASKGRWTDRLYVDGLENDTTYYFAVRSRNYARNRYSDFSEEFAIELGTPRAGDIQPLSIDSGEILAGSDWQWVSFDESFEDPIVIATPNGRADGDPFVVRIDGIEPDGFWIRAQEWCYLDGQHSPVPLAYVAVERGRHQLPNGSWIEAGRLTTDATGTYVQARFAQAFPSDPVVLASVTSARDDDAVGSQLRGIDRTGFMVGMTEQEAADQHHLHESIDYIAWGTGSGAIGDLDYEVGATGATVTHAVHRLRFDAPHSEPPLMLLSMQTSYGGDPATVHVEDKSRSSADVLLREEQSFDYETWHVAEQVGYLILGRKP